jgi:hypothetical protein
VEIPRAPGHPHTASATQAGRPDRGRRRESRNPASARRRAAGSAPARPPG